MATTGALIGAIILLGLHNLVMFPLGVGWSMIKNRNTTLSPQTSVRFTILNRRGISLLSPMNSNRSYDDWTHWLKRQNKVEVPGFTLPIANTSVWWWFKVSSGMMEDPQRKEMTGRTKTIHFVHNVHGYSPDVCALLWNRVCNHLVGVEMVVWAQIAAAYGNSYVTQYWRHQRKNSKHFLRAQIPTSSP